MNKTWHVDNPIRCPMLSTINIIGGKWKPIILHMLSSGTLRFGELKKNIPPISQKILTQQLRELESDKIIFRTIYNEIPPKVEYALSKNGVTLIPVLEALYEWGENHMDSAS